MAEEFLDIVDSKDNTIGRAPRSHIHNSKLWHRGIHIILLDSDGRVILQNRSPTKDKWSGKYDLSVSGHVNAGEGYDDVARREIYEELGIKGMELKKLIKLRLDYGAHDNMISVVFSGKCDGGFLLDEDETDFLVFMSPEKLRKELSENSHRFARWTREILKWYLGMESQIELIETY
ncbi:MAG: NUDIX domain-containing protein [Candidatus Micrarchaeota archaeon]|nr:NUDIX domain-containing protein [Candidatus Micrarchaeota archaeon]